jgi:hypothetical protein
MTGIAGTWHLRMKTPIGTFEADYRFTETDGGVTGTAVGAGEQTTLENVVRTATADGERVTWRQEITKPMRLNLEYDVTVTGDTLAGHSRAGRLPRTPVTGERAGA